MDKSGVVQTLVEAAGAGVLDEEREADEPPDSDEPLDPDEEDAVDEDELLALPPVSDLPVRESVR